MKLSPAHTAFLALIVANIIWGAAAPIFKLSLQNIPPFTLAFLRFYIGMALMIIFFGKRLKPPHFDINDTVLLLINALAGITLNIALFFIGLTMTLSINAPVIASSAPIMTMLFAMLFLKEKVSPKMIVGMILGAIGILVIIIEPLIETGIDGSLWGNILLVGATIAAVVGTISGKKLLDRFDPMMITFWTFVIGAISFVPLAVHEYIQTPTLFAALDWRGYTGIIFGSVFSSAVAYALYNWGLSKVSATDTSLFTYIDPVVGAVLSYLILSEPLTLPYFIGAFLIFGGIGIAEGRLHYHPIGKLLFKQKQ